MAGRDPGDMKQCKLSWIVWESPVYRPKPPALPDKTCIKVQKNASSPEILDDISNFGKNVLIFYEFLRFNRKISPLNTRVKKGKVGDFLNFDSFRLAALLHVADCSC